MIIVPINGAAQSGKDTFCEYVKNVCRMCHDITVFKMSSIDDVKNIAMEMGWNGVKTDYSRKFLSDLKDLWTVYNDGPLNNFKKKVAGLYDSYPYAVILYHVREPEEIKKLKDYYTKMCITVLVRRPGVPVPDNHADQNVEKFKYNVMVNNSSNLAALYTLAEKFSWILRKKIDEQKIHKRRPPGIRIYGGSMARKQCLGQ